MTSRQRWIILLIVYGLFLAIGIAGILTALKLVDSTPEFAEWSRGILLADVAAAAIAVFKTTFQSSEAHACVNVVFEGAKPRDIDVVRCEYVVYDSQLTVKKEGRAAAISGPGGWQCQFSWPAAATDTAQLTIVEQSGREWKVPFFSPTTVEQRAVRIGGQS